MESSAFLSRSMRRVLEERSEVTTFHMPQFSCGQQVQIASGPLAGMHGLLVKQTLNGLWIVQLADLAPGVLLCIGASYFEGCP